MSAKELAGAARPDETTVREPLPLESIPEPLARALQSVGSLLDNTSWERVAAYIEGIAAERSRYFSKSDSANKTVSLGTVEPEKKDSSTISTPHS